MRVKAIRLSIGIEHRDAIIADIGQALAGAGNQILRAAE
jgi:O-acetylhomoserine/O-acetylserine sulfhydrylase-like pyridoxal-dependent enzyme